LAAPNGQALGFSAYGIQWIQSTWAGILTMGDPNPWLASNLYMVYSIFIIAFSVYVALRVLSVSRLLAVIAAIAMTSLRGVFAWAGWPFLQNYAGLFLFTALALRVLSADRQSVSILPNGLSRAPDQAKRTYSIILLLFTIAVSATGDNYYMWFGLFVLTFAFGVTLIRSRMRLDQGPKQMLLLLISQAMVIFVAMIPIVLSRLLSGLPIREDSLSDRRAFAALANGGEIPGLFLLENNTFLMTLFRQIPSIGGFLDEYDSSSLVISEDYRGGAAPALLLILLGVILVMRVRSSNNFKIFEQPSSLPLKLALVLLAFSIFLYVRGGGGLLISFIFPFLRAFDRSIVLVSFLSIVSLALIATNGNLFSKRLRVAALLSLSLVAADNLSGIQEREQTLARVDNGYFLTSSLSDIESLAASADNSFDSDCAVLVLPVTTYPVDFSSSVVSYATYETIKPGLVNSRVSWTSGALPGTPGSHPNARFRELFLARDYGRLQSESEQEGVCGLVIFSGLQDAMARANPAQFDSSEVLRGSFIQKYPDVCFEEKETGLVLLCDKGDY
jgi:hypothetical protein